MLTFSKSTASCVVKCPSFHKSGFRLHKFQQEPSVNEAVACSYQEVLVSICPIIDVNIHHLANLASVSFLYKKGKKMF